MQTKRNEHQRRRVAVEAARIGDASAAKSAQCSVATVAKYRQEFGLSVATRRPPTDTIAALLKEPLQIELPDILHHYTPEMALNAAQLSEDPELLRAVAQHYPHPCSDLKSYVLDNYNCPADLFDDLANEALTNSAQNAETLYVLAYRVTDESTDVAVKMANMVVNGETDVGEELANNFRLPIAALRILSKHPDATIRREAMLNKIADKEILAEGAQDSYDTIRLAVATHINTHADTLSILLQDRESSVRTAAKRNPNLAVSDIESLVETHPEDVANNIMTPSHLLLQVADPTVSHRQKGTILRHPNCDETHIRRLFPDGDTVNNTSPYLIDLIVNHHKTPADVLDRIARENDSYLTSASIFSDLIQHGNTSQATLEYIVDTDPRGWSAVVTLNHINADIIEKMYNIAIDYEFHHKDAAGYDLYSTGTADKVLRKLLWHSATPTNIQEAIQNRGRQMQTTDHAVDWSYHG